MKTNWVKRFCRGLLLTGLAGAGLGLAGCANEYAAYPAYRGGYYASYRAPYPYYGGYGYPYRAYGPYYGYYSRPYYGSPYYGGSTVIVSRNRSYALRDRSGRWQNRRVTNRPNRARTINRNNPPRRQIQQSSDNDDESRYYNNRP